MEALAKQLPWTSRSILCYCWIVALWMVAVQAKNAFVRTDHQGDPRLPTLSVKGDYYDVGYQAGVYFKQRIELFYDYFDAAIELELFASSPTGRVWLQRWRSAAEQYFPNVIQEMKGLANGSGQDFDRVFLYHAASEISALLHPGKPTTPSCSDILVNTQTQPVLNGHNEDAGMAAYNTSYMLEVEVVVDDVTVEQFVAFSYAGIVPGKGFGFNSHGLSFTVNAVFVDALNQGPESAPRPFLARKLLGAKSLAEAMTMLTLGNKTSNPNSRSWVSSSSVNVGSHNNGNGTLFNVELTDVGASMERVDNGFLHHFNMLQHSATTQVFDVSSIHRLTRLMQLPGPSDLATTLAILSDNADTQYPIFRGGAAPDGVVTVATAVIDFTTGTVDIYTEQPLPTATPTMTYEFPSPLRQN